MMPPLVTEDRAWLDAWLSPARFDPYVRTCGGDIDAAFGLYLWNVGLAQATLRDVAFFEVALRNAYDRCIRRWWSGDGHWLFDDDSPIRRPIMRRNRRREITDANKINREVIGGLRKSLRRRATPDRIISNLTLGFWAHMTDTAHERVLWIPCIHHAWPAGTNRKSINKEIGCINRLRNRAVHHEHLFNLDEAGLMPSVTDETIGRLFHDLVPRARDHAYRPDGTTSIRRYLTEHPVPSGVIV